MGAMQPFGLKGQFLRTSDILATPKLTVRSLDDVRAPNLNLLLFKTPLGLTAISARKWGGI